MIRILLAEDEKAIRDSLIFNLQLENYEVITAKNGLAPLDKFKSEHFDIILLDVMMPELDGLAVCEQIRLTNVEIPVIFLTAKDTVTEKINGLKKGANDYITKPFNLEELLLRIQIHLKTSTTTDNSDVFEISFGDNAIHLNTYEAKGPNGTFQLSKKEVMLLKLLFDRKNQVVSRQQILQSVWGYDVFPSTRTIDNFILAFRKYFEKDPKNPIYFQSIRGVGYKLSV